MLTYNDMQALNTFFNNQCRLWMDIGGETLVNSRDLAAEIESILLDVYFAGVGEKPTNAELFVVYDFLKKNTTYAAVVRGAEFLIKELGRVEGKV